MLKKELINFYKYRSVEKYLFTLFLMFYIHNFVIQVFYHLHRIGFHYHKIFLYFHNFLFLITQHKDVHVQMAQTRNEMVQIGPNQCQCDQFHEPARYKAQANVESSREFGVRDLGSDGTVKQPDDEWHQQKHQETADAVQDGDDACRWQAVRRQVFQGVDVAEFRPLSGEFSHVCTFWV